jgi:hypothetical protein
MAPAAAKPDAGPDNGSHQSATQENNAGRRGKKRLAADTPNPTDDHSKRLRSVDGAVPHVKPKDGNSNEIPAANDQEAITNRKRAHDFVKLAMKAVTTAKDDRCVAVLRTIAFIRQKI